MSGLERTPEKPEKGSDEESDEDDEEDEGPSPKIDTRLSVVPWRDAKSPSKVQDNFSGARLSFGGSLSFGQRLRPSIFSARGEYFGDEPAVKVDDYSFLGQELLTWCIPFLITGWKNRPIHAEQIPVFPSKFCAERTVPRLEEAWQQSMKRAKQSGGKAKPSLAKATCSVIRGLIIQGVSVAVFNGIVNSFVRPYLLRQCLMWMTEKSEDNLRGGLLCAGLFVVSVLEGWSAMASLRNLSDEAYSIFTSGVSGLICRKAFTVDRGGRSGQATALLGNDVIRAYEQAKHLGMVPLGLASLAGGIVMLFLTIGKACIAGLVSMFLMFVVTRLITRRMTVAMRINLENSAARIAVLDQIVDSSKAVKFFSWEEQYLDMLESKRRTEVQSAGRFRWYQICSIQLGRATPVISAAASIASMVLLDMELKAADIFAVISVFQVLRLCLIVLPQGYGAIKVVLLSVKRVQQFLELPDEEPPPYLPRGSPTAVQLTSASLAWPLTAATKNGESKAADKETQSIRTIISNCNLEVPKGQLLAVVGPVGSGKTTLLSGIVGEMAPQSGAALIAEDLVYVPQQPQVISGTLQDNILLGRPLDEAKMQEAVNAAQLAHDLEILDGGINTEIGERGASLSGGQKQRISLARSIYNMTPETLLVLDDPIAAVDPRVGKLIMQDIVLAHKQRGGTVVVALNQREHLHYFDVAVEIRNGEVVPMVVPPAAEEGMQTPLDVDSMLEPKSGKKSKKKGAALDFTQKGSAMIEKEIQAKGAMGVRVLTSFVAAWGALRLGGYMVCNPIAYSLMVGSDLWLVRWSRDGSEYTNDENLKNLGVYFAIVALFTVMVLLTSKTAVSGCVQASKTLHQQTMARLMKAPSSWWDSTEKGRITSRFSTDMGIVDTLLGFFFDNTCQLCTTVLALSIIICIVAPIIIPAIFIGVSVLVYLCYLVDITNREVKRYATKAVGPVLGNIAECEQMKLISRTLNCQHFFEERNARNMDKWNVMNFNSNMLMHWSRFMSSNIASLIAGGTAAWLMFGGSGEPESAAIAMTYSIIMPYFLGFASMIAFQLKAQFTCLERVLEYLVLPQEPEWHLPSDPSGQAWPQGGALEFRSVSMRYRQALPLALTNVSFTIPAGARTGVIGRTGSGKSTLVACIFRLHEAESGSVLIDGVDVKGLGLRCMRKRITVVPQDPVLMQGTIRTNLDPFGKVSDDDLRQSLQSAFLASKDDESYALLDKELSPGGANLSCGERQLLCLARAVIAKPVVLAMDEPTSSTDPETDKKLQSMMRTEFKCTSLMIAHRIQTVADSDLLMVMRNGELLQAGPPSELVKDTDGEFYAMVQMTGVQVPGAKPPVEKVTI